MEIRKRLEKNEAQLLAAWGTRSSASRGRVFPEAESVTRTAFQRDRDRIIHTTAFRRLEYKTQVFVFYEGDHYRTRLTHTLEVAQLGRSLARSLGANEELTEAICLAHDLGHAPFGHAGEAALNRLMADHGGFNHNTQSYRVVTRLEKRYPDFDGLNLTYETREGMIKHETRYDKSDASGYEPEKRGALEAQIANLADEMAYNAHDLEDGLRAALFPVDDLDALAVWQRLREQVGWRRGPLDDVTRHAIIRELIGMTVTDVVATTLGRLEAAGLNSADAVQRHPVNVVGYSADMETLILPLKQFLYDRMYRHYRLVRMSVKAERILGDIFRAYLNEPRMLPTKTQALLGQLPTPRIIADYIAGMTDRYALDEHEKLFDPYRRS
jgi:dGTPase